MKETFWTFKSTNPIVPPTWRSWACCHVTRGGLYHRLLTEYGRTEEMAAAMGLEAVQVAHCEIPREFQGNTFVPLILSTANGTLVPGW